MTEPQALTEWLNFAAGGPLEFTIQYPPRPEYFQEHFSAIPDDAGFTDSPPELLYVHVPFCSGRCGFCAFATETSPSPERLSEYVRAVLTELERYPRLLQRGVACLDIGGGTPLILPEGDLDRLLSTLAPLVRKPKTAARSIETTPEEVCASPGKLRILRNRGFDRISMGVQTVGRKALREAHRYQEASVVRRAAEYINAAQFPRLNIDLIFGLPGQTLATWQKDLRAALEISPDSITTYDCLHRQEGRALTRPHPKLPTTRRMGELYNRAYAVLADEGFQADYGSLNFSRHLGETGTSLYFERRLQHGDAYLGLGAHATSLAGDRWRFNARHVDDYLGALRDGRSPTEWSYRLPTAEQQAKYLLFSLNFGCILAARFQALFHQELESVLGEELALAVERGWLRRDATGYRLCEGQFEHIYEVRSLLYTRGARRWLREWVR